MSKAAKSNRPKSTKRTTDKAGRKGRGAGRAGKDSGPSRGPARLPGDPSKAAMIERMLRVNHAGEYGAVRIYEGQLAVLENSASGPVIAEMAEQEREHLDRFEDMIPAHRVRPTALLPLWHLAGFALGAGSALLGEKAAMACTVAVEEVIDAHYAGQVARLDAEGGADELRDAFERFRLDELSHRDTGLEHGAAEAPGYEVLTGLVKAGSRLAIWLSTRI